MATFSGRFLTPAKQAPGAVFVRGPIPRAETAALILLGIVSIGAPLMYGGAFPWTVVAIAVAAVAALVTAVWSMREQGMAAPWLALAICGAAAWTLLQAAPLPCWLVARLAPESASELRSVLGLVGSAPPTWCHLSRDPGATRLEVLKGVAIAASFLAAWILSVQGGRDRVIWLVACSTLAMSAVAHLHMALGWTEVFGVYQPRHAGRGLQLAPLMNPNNLGAFAAMGVPIWWGILRRARGPRARALAAFAIVLTATTALLSLSRSAIGMLFGSIALMGFLSLTRTQRTRRSGRAPADRRWLPRLAIALSLAVAVGLGAYLAADQVLREFALGYTGKLMLIGHSFGFAAQHPWIGVGRGAFASTFVGSGLPGNFTHAENFLAQWAADWGLPVTLALVVALGHALWFAARAAQSPRHVGAIVGLVALGAQNLFDLGLEVAGVAVVATSLLAAVVAPSRRSRRPSAAQRVPMRRLSAFVAAAGAAALLWLGPSAEADSTDELDDALRRQLNARDRRGFRRSLERAARLHPVQPVFAVLAAGEALVHGDRKALGWINRGMRLAPGWTAPHVQAFQWLWPRGRRSQALLELRAAAEIDPLALGAYVCEVAAMGSDSVLRAAPRARNRQRAAFLELASSCSRPEEPVSAELDAVLLREFASSALVHERQAVRLAKGGELDAALGQLAAARRQQPEREHTRVLQVQLLFDSGRYVEAARDALTLARTTEPKTAAMLWTLRARALAELGDDAGWTAAVASLRGAVSDDVDRLADTYALEGELHRKRRQAGAALRAYREAYRINDETRFLAAYADVSMELGDRASALWAFMRLCEIEPKDKGAPYCAARDSLVKQNSALNQSSGVRN